MGCRQLVDTAIIEGASSPKKRLLSQAPCGFDTGAKGQIKYAYNQLGQRVLDDRTMPDGHQLARFTYNQRLELIKSKRERGGCAPPEVHTYAYDLNHNRIEADGVNYSNNLADQLLSVGAGGSLTYNDAGQAQNVQGWDVTYNCADQITGIQMPGKSIAYRYDGAGQRVQKTVNGVTQKFLWNGGDIAKEYNADDSVKADYFLGAGREGIKTNGQWHYYLSDIQGSTLMLTDSSGNSAATYDYSDFGETTQTSGSTSLYNPFLYTGQEYDFETSLYHLRARHYSPGLGRFFARDPIGYAGGSNMYAYCAGDPIGCSDPSGLRFVLSSTAGPALDRIAGADPYRLSANDLGGCFADRFRSASNNASGVARFLLNSGQISSDIATDLLSILGAEEDITADLWTFPVGSTSGLAANSAGTALLLTERVAIRTVAQLTTDLVHEAVHIALVRTFGENYSTRPDFSSLADPKHPAQYFPASIGSH